ncbi:MAG: carboxylate--amine ligase [Gammaproteobacteria bacterium]|nr:carboxylate--amine ligase [Gammaproteobacteria bacterium]MCP5196497.1 carboxylate--amine ligase [Gammaproteobacteria bacterium]
MIGLANRERSIGLASRYLERGIVIGMQRDERLIKTLRELGDVYEGAVLLAVSENDLTWLINHQNQFKCVKAITPPASAFRQVLDKARTLKIAEELGIRVPCTYSSMSMDEWCMVAAQVRYPVIVKWADPVSVIPWLQEQGILWHKIEYALDQSALLNIGERYVPAGQWPLIQEYCSGRGLGQFFFLYQGKVLRRFQHLRIAEWPPEGGFSSVCDVVPLSKHQALQERSIALLHAIGWEGCAMVEYRLDEATGEAALMEINGRFWGSFPLAVHAGAGFASLAYFVQGLGQIPPLSPLRENLRCRMISTEVKRLIRIIFQSEKIVDPYYVYRPGCELARFVLDFLRSNVRYYVWAMDDPGPFWADLRNYGLRLLGR